MKKIDFHIHTVPVNGKDSSFTFNIEKFQHYIDELSIDAVAITNHNLFNLEQFETISSTLQNVIVFPGIEIDFEDGHLLLIGENNNLQDFDQKCKLISAKLNCREKITEVELKEIFKDLSDYLLIPHYAQRREISKHVINSLHDYIFVGEVQSPKKFYKLIKKESGLTPVLFSDVRISTNLDIEKYQGNQTFIKTDVDPLTLTAIITALKDKNKVFLSNLEQHDFFQVFGDGQKLSHGLNIVLGSRSSGKTFFLNKLENIFDKDGNQIKYIRQFDLIKVDEEEFNKILEKERSNVRENHLSCFRKVVDDVVKIDRRTTSYEMQEYLESLIKFAKSEEIQDEFSKAALFKEIPFTIHTDNSLETILKAIKSLLENKEYKAVIEKYLPEVNLRNLLNELKKQFKEKNKEKIRKLWVNNIIEVVAQKLHECSSSPSIKLIGIDFYDIALEREKIKRFNAIVKAIQKEKIIDNRSFGEKFKVQALVGPFLSSQELREESKTRDIAFSEVFKKYKHPFEYLEELKKLSIDRASLYRYFCKVRYHVLNEYDKPVSGGEQSEFNLLKALQDARQFEMLLIDEPESSFDNIFLKDNVNQMIKEISKELPVVVVTHNSTVGMSMQPDYILYTKRETSTGNDEYYLYSGSLGDSKFKTADGTREVDSYTAILDTLEAGDIAYKDRAKIYNNLKVKS